jgi:archaellum biogenesis ATPase FlaH
MKKAVSVGEYKDTGINLFDNIMDVLSDDFRSPIPTGIKGLDNLMDGGLSKGELGVILAPFGVGKTTLVTRFAHTAWELGYNVVQIFFEDNPKVIQKKHTTCMTGIALNDLNSSRIEEVEKLVEQKRSERENHLILKKFPSANTTMQQIEQYLRKLISDGIRPDIVLLDYIDCVVSNRQYKDEYAGEGDIMRSFETMISDLNIVGWTAVQGNRSSIGADIVDSNMIGGSIKKGQIGHFILSVARTIPQKEDNLATMAILKSRFGKDGIVFEDIRFDNGLLHIDTTETSNTSLMQMSKFKDKSNQDRVTNALDKVNRAKNSLKNKIQ